MRLIIFNTVGTSLLTSSSCWKFNQHYPRLRLSDWLSNKLHVDLKNDPETLNINKVVSDTLKQFDENTFKTPNGLQKLPAELTTLAGICQFLQGSFNLGAEHFQIENLYLLTNAAGATGQFCGLVLEELLRKYPGEFNLGGATISSKGFQFNPGVPDHFFQALTEMTAFVKETISSKLEEKTADEELRFIINRTAGYKTMGDPLVALAAKNPAVPIDIAYIYQGVDPANIIFVHFDEDTLKITRSSDYGNQVVSDLKIAIR